MKRNGFTLVEVLAVIVVIGLILVITIPNITKISKQTKMKAYDTKVDLIEHAAVLYGLENKSLIIKGQTPQNQVSSTVTIVTDNKGKVTSLNFNYNKAYNATETLNSNEYRGNYVLIKDLVEANQLNWDKENQCPNCTTTNKTYYDNVVVNPMDNSIINGCYVYIYYKNNQVYAHFDRDLCNQTSSYPGFTGKQYNPVNN